MQGERYMGYTRHRAKHESGVRSGFWAIALDRAHTNREVALELDLLHVKRIASGLVIWRQTFIVHYVERFPNVTKKGNAEVLEWEVRGITGVGVRHVGSVNRS